MNAMTNPIALDLIAQGQAKIAEGSADIARGHAALAANLAPPAPEPPKPEPIRTPTIKVASLADLQNALKAAELGAVIQLAKGSYGALALKGVVAPSVRVVGEGATLAGLRVINSSGLAFEAFSADLVEGGMVQIDNSARILLAHMSSKNAKLYGFSVIKSSGVDLLDCEAAEVKDGFQLTNSHQVTIQRGKVRRFRADGINICGGTRLLIDGNDIRDGAAAPGAHSDAVQFHTGSAEGSTEDVVVSNNIAHRGTGTLFQGFFASDQNGSRPYRRMRFENNQAIGCMQRGLSVSHGEDIEFKGNLVQPIEGQNSGIYMSAVTGGRVWENRYALIDVDKSCTGVSVEDKKSLNHISAAQALALLPPA